MIFSAEYLEPCQRIWEGYKLYARGCATTRVGFELAGHALFGGDSPCDMSMFPIRGESILEHQAKAAWLTVVFISNFYASSSDQELMNLSALSLVHDVGESVIGDIPDDGRVEHENKGLSEREFFESFVLAYAEPHRKDILDKFKEFQDKNTFSGQLVYAIDKLEFVLMSLFLETFDIYGSLKSKNPPTPQDKYFMDLTHTDAATDCWVAHTLVLLSPLNSRISEPALTLIDVAVCDVRGEHFPWWDNIPLSNEENK